MGVPAFYRWLSEKYPKIVQDVLEERIMLAGADGSVRLPFDATRPNPSGLECDNLYIDMNGIIHPCSHPENGPQPTTEEEMYENVCDYVDRLFRLMRPRKLLYLAIDGVAPRAKMNQQRARRFRSAQEARELKELEENVRVEIEKTGGRAPPTKDPWDSNVITPGTPFMLRLADFIRFYIRKRISTDKAWKNIRVIFSDASVPGEGEHKIMSHIRLQRAQPGYDPNQVHILHGLDADLIMLALATHEPHFYISREEVLFGRRSMEQQEQRQLESGFRDKQKALDEAAGEQAMTLLENQQKPIQRISIPILREYLAIEFASCMSPRLPFAPSLERLIDDIVFLCFFVGNDFLPHLPSLDIRDGALDFLFNVYKRVLPSLGDYITKSGGNVNLSHVDIILAEVGAIEDYVFAMKHDNEQREERRRKEMRDRKKKGIRGDAPPPLQLTDQPRKAMGKAAKILARQQQGQVALSRGHQAKDDLRSSLKAKHMMADENAKAALALKESLIKSEQHDSTENVEEEMVDTIVKSNNDGAIVAEEAGVGQKRSHEQIEPDVTPEESDQGTKSELMADESTPAEAIGVVGDAEVEFDADDDDEEADGVPKIEDIVEEVDPEAAKKFKEAVKVAQQKQLDDYAKSVDDKVRLHESGWKDRYYTDKCKADDVSANGGREHLFRSYVVGLCWVMKYYYDGCASWKWYFPFHYAPFASDLKNIERFQKECRVFELSTPFNPVEQLMAVLPSDSAHAIPKAARWLMLDGESPIIDFYPRDVPVDPNGKAMPWLWVVLLPFIDEERLLAAMSPTMANWSKEELLCNARGLDDGYLFIHVSHPLGKKVAQVVGEGKTAKSPKTRLTDSASYGCAGFSGSLRPPLSNEIFPLDDETEILPPPSSRKISHRDSLFSDPLDRNDVICVAFTEPSKLSHKSVLLPGAKVLPQCLTDDDKVIRRPRLNRGGGTIANLGVSNGQSFQSGYGSMNVSSYERRLAEQTGRAGQLNQPGLRAWGAMEPVQKRQRPYPAVTVGNPFQQPNNQGNARPPHNGSSQQRSWQQGPPQRAPYYQSGQMPAPPPNHHQGRFMNQHHERSGQHHNGSPAHHGRQQRPSNHQQNQYNFQQQNQPSNRPSPPNGGPGRGFDFRGFQQGGPPRPPNPPPQRSRASADVMNSLRAQLSNTLKQHRPGGRPGDRR